MSEMYDQLMGEFGSKVRSLLNFATDTISEAGQKGIELEAQLISKPTKLENITDILKSNLQKEGLLLSEKAVSASGLSDKELKIRMASCNLMPKPPLITSHNELTKSEFNALLQIGLPENVITTPVPASLFPT
ncbi:hypothetical protein [Shewanella surugensis]|uniref:Uncharacterized protein n=1 Tax=Shewanella surugensis TaxID=212020 RepID=A0ABT0LIZ7_9GAMM|nr:hypothetical protein [Shewanella surugensis]MCL1127569.1 hypothetical protein [Shewanella surugensis]